MGSKLLYGKKHDFCTTFSLRCTCWSKLPCITISLSPNVPTKKDLRFKVQRWGNGEQITLWEKPEFCHNFYSRLHLWGQFPIINDKFKPKCSKKEGSRAERELVRDGEQI